MGQPRTALGTGVEQSTRSCARAGTKNHEGEGKREKRTTDTPTEITVGWEIRKLQGGVRTRRCGLL